MNFVFNWILFLSMFYLCFFFDLKLYFIFFFRKYLLGNFYVLGVVLGIGYGYIIENNEI